MKKLTLALLSVLAFGSAAAAQDSVTVYGCIDLGVGISRINDGFGSKENNAQRHLCQYLAFVCHFIM